MSLQLKVHQSKMAEFEDIKNEAEHKKRSLIKVKAVEVHYYFYLNPMQFLY